LLSFFAVADLNAIRAGKDAKPRKARLGQCFPNTMIIFDKAEGASVNLTGKSKG
jgi:vesicle-fusing ATPase